jgi:hypothetical protein
MPYEFKSHVRLDAYCQLAKLCELHSHQCAWRKLHRSARRSIDVVQDEEKFYDA